MFTRCDAWVGWMQMLVSSVPPLLLLGAASASFWSSLQCANLFWHRLHTFNTRARIIGTISATAGSWVNLKFCFIRRVQPSSGQVWTRQRAVLNSVWKQRIYEHILPEWQSGKSRRRCVDFGRDIDAGGGQLTLALAAAFCGDSGSTGAASSASALSFSSPSAGSSAAASSAAASGFSSASACKMDSQRLRVQISSHAFWHYFGKYRTNAKAETLTAQIACVSDLYIHDDSEKWPIWRTFEGNIRQAGKENEHTQWNRSITVHAHSAGEWTGNAQRAAGKADPSQTHPCQTRIGLWLCSLCLRQHTSHSGCQLGSKWSQLVMKVSDPQGSLSPRTVQWKAGTYAIQEGG